MPFSYAILPQLIVWKLEAMADARGSKFTLTERYCDYAQRVSRVWLPDTCGRAAAASARATASTVSGSRSSVSAPAVTRMNDPAPCASSGPAKSGSAATTTNLQRGAAAR